jgi:hypothetical protein
VILSVAGLLYEPTIIPDPLAKLSLDVTDAVIVPPEIDPEEAWR